VTKRVDVADGKYSFILDERDLIVDVLRCGEPWQVGLESFRFNNCVTAMLWELMELREKVANDSQQSD